MSAQSKHAMKPPMDFSKWRMVPLALMALGGLGVLIGFVMPGLRQQAAFSWLVAYMFFLSLCLGALFLVLVHHLFDANWSVPLRRMNEQIAWLMPVMAVLFLPIAVLAPLIYPWFKTLLHPEQGVDHALHAKFPLVTIPGFYIASVFCLGVWCLLAYKLRYWSLRQDETGAAECTYRMRFTSYWGIFAFAVTLTLGGMMWVKTLFHHWFSTMYGVYYFAGSVWMTLATIYLLMAMFHRQGPLRTVIHPNQYYFVGSLLFAFTVFYAYIHFAQYFIIWNANIPEETFWYVLREKGGWWDVGILLIFIHFFLPFLLLLRIDLKHWVPLIVFLAVLAWVMHYLDMSFNIMPRLHPDGFVLHWLDICAMAFMGGLLFKMFLRNFYAHPFFPQKDPRFHETMGVYLPPAMAPDESEDELEDELEEGGAAV